MNWWKRLKGKVKVWEPLKGHTTFKIGGKARFFIRPQDAADLRALLAAAKRRKMPLFVMGAGSNILASDNGIDGAVLQLDSPYFRKLSFQGRFARAGAGLRLSRFISAAQKRGLSGYEFLAGIPGSVGGALAMNAGGARKGASFTTLVENVTVMDYNGGVKTFAREDLKSGYRNSNLSGYIILSAGLKLKKGNKKKVRKKIDNYLACRRASQELRWPSAGCVFKNPPGRPAGKLIDLCGLKGRSCGDAFVSAKHANFILNRGQARAEDVLKLMRIIRKKVKSKFGLELEPEIKIWR